MQAYHDNPFESHSNNSDADLNYYEPRPVSTVKDLFVLSNSTTPMIDNGILIPPQPPSLCLYVSQQGLWSEAD